MIRYGFLIVVALGSFPTTVAGKKHILALLIDDYGWADAGWHAHAKPGRNPQDPRAEVQTPNLDALVAQGIELERNYVFQVCSPTRSAIQSGRNPIHVNSVNLDPLNYNRADNISGFQGVPRNMTGMAEVLRRAPGGGMATRFYGKWDCGMATLQHTPHGRGYQRSLSYFHHMVNYWSSDFENDNGQTDFFPQCKAVVDPSKYPGGSFRPVDFWHADGRGYEGPWRGSERGPANSARCSPSNVDLCKYDKNSTCPPYPGWPGNQTAGCTFEDELFKRQLLRDLDDYDPTAANSNDSGLFVFWAPHVVHTPLQPPQASLERFAHVVDWRRRRYLALVHYIDEAVGEVVAALKKKQMWEDTLMVMSSDNGGPIYASGAAGANNFPLKGGKASNWEGGIRVNSFVSGGLLPPSRRGIKLDGLATPWDWLATFADVVGITDIDDTKAAAAGLPPVDSQSLWPYWSGKDSRSPRKSLALGDKLPRTTVQGYILDNRDGREGSGWPGLWKLLLGNLTAAGWQSESFPNASTGNYPTQNCGESGCLFELTSDPNEYNDVAVAQPQVVARLHGAIAAAQKTAFDPDRGAQDPQSCVSAMQQWNGFWGPWVQVQ